jgi:hypothetical protein
MLIKGNIKKSFEKVSDLNKERLSHKKVATAAIFVTNN